jgi:hypothetical protein
MYTLPIRRLRDILKHVVPEVTLTSVDEVPSTRLPRLYNLNLSDGEQMLLSFAPSLAIRLLRHEQTLLSSEAMLISFITGILKPKASEEEPLLTDSETTLQTSRGSELTQLVPTLLKHSSNTREIGYPYTIFEPVVGEPLSKLMIYLSLTEQQQIDKQIGSLVRDLALITSPSGKFGTVSRVCDDPFKSDTVEPSSSLQGSTDWTCAFMSLVEGILRDGEDMSVLLPYDVIRGHYQRLAWRLSAVTVPRLVVIDAGDATNVLVERDTEGESPPTSLGPRVTGLRDWSQGIFGDPLISSCFDDPSEGFLDGWRLDGSEDIIEDEEGAPVRSLLYGCYRACVNIVTEYYRPQPDSSRRELEGRRKLTNVLVELSKVDIEENAGSKRSRIRFLDRIDSVTDESTKRQKLDAPAA